MSYIEHSLWWFWAMGAIIVAVVMWNMWRKK